MAKQKGEVLEKTFRVLGRSRGMFTMCDIELVRLEDLLQQARNVLLKIQRYYNKYQYKQTL
jgi:hypothetical protein